MDEYFIPELVKLINSYITYEKSWFDQFLKDNENGYITITKVNIGYYKSDVELIFGNNCNCNSTKFYFAPTQNFNEHESLFKVKGNLILTNDARDCIERLLKMNRIYKNCWETCYRIECNGEFLTLRRIENKKSIIIVENGKTFNELLVELYDDIIKN